MKKTKNNSLAILEEMTDSLFKKESLIKAILKAQQVFIQEQSYKKSFNLFLQILLEHTSSEYGFIGEIRYKKEDNAPYLKTFAITNIAWDDSTRQFYEENAPKGMEFGNLATLFGRTLATGEIIMTNKPQAHKYSGGLPKGHPALNAYLGMPIKWEGRLMGMFGIANRPSGYDMNLLKQLSPLVDSIGTFIYGYQKSRELKMECNNIACSVFTPAPIKHSTPEGIYAKLAKGHK